MLGRREGEAVRPKPFAVLRQEGRAGEEAEIHRIEIVAEAGERDLLGAHRAARRLAPLEHADRPAAAREVHRGGEAVVPGADDDRIEVHRTTPELSSTLPGLHPAAEPSRCVRMTSVWISACSARNDAT